MDGLLELTEGALDVSTVVTSSKVGDFLNNGGDLLNVSTDLTDFVANFDKSTDLNVVKNLGGKESNDSDSEGNSTENASSHLTSAFSKPVKKKTAKNEEQKPNKTTKVNNAPA